MLIGYNCPILVYNYGTEYQLKVLIDYLIYSRHLKTPKYLSIIYYLNLKLKCVLWKINIG